jgi:hypothetical protein
MFRASTLKKMKKERDAEQKRRAEIFQYKLRDGLAFDQKGLESKKRWGPSRLRARAEHRRIARALRKK